MRLPSFRFVVGVCCVLFVCCYCYCLFVVVIVIVIVIVCLFCFVCLLL